MCELHPQNAWRGGIWQHHNLFEKVIVKKHESEPISYHHAYSWADPSSLWAWRYHTWRYHTKRQWMPDLNGNQGHIGPWTDKTKVIPTTTCKSRPTLNTRGTCRNVHGRILEISYDLALCVRITTCNGVGRNLRVQKRSRRYFVQAHGFQLICCALIFHNKISPWWCLFGVYLPTYLITYPSIYLPTYLPKKAPVVLVVIIVCFCVQCSAMEPRCDCRCSA